MYGRTRMYNLGFAVFTLFSLLLSATWLHGTAGALWLIAMRLCQGVGGAMLMANSSAILTDAFPPDQRGLALGLNQVAGIAGSFAGLVLGGLLGPLNWRLVFLVSVPFGLFGIWLPRHGYGFAETPLWAGIYMLPLTLGFLVAGPVSGWASDRFGARTFATGGMLLAAGTFAALQALPVDFDYPAFAVILLLNGIGMGLFAAPNRAAVMNSLPPDQRGVGAGISTTFQNSAMVLSIGVFFSLMITGLAGSLPHTLTGGLTAQGVPAADAARIAALPPVGVLFASLLGYNPVRTLLGPQVLGRLPPGHAGYLTGREFFPQLISAPFAHGLAVAFDFAIAACLVAAVASLLRGGRYVHDDRARPERRTRRPEPAPAAVPERPLAPPPAAGPPPTAPPPGPTPRGAPDG
ncbi:MFS transporter [Streptomyces sp. NPDC059152]|uniref:MFS transporter n=1 Tax=Streptomyces sp. NPDC059152 TaxID=3346742 RepID=UPI00369D43AA